MTLRLEFLFPRSKKVGKCFTEMAKKIVLQNARSLVTMMSASFKIINMIFELMEIGIFLISLS